MTKDIRLYAIMFLVVVMASSLVKEFMVFQAKKKHNELGNTPLMEAVLHNNVDTVKKLIEKEDAINTKNNYGDTAILYASRNGDTEIVKYLIKKGADVNISNNEKVTPLMEAVFSGRKSTIEILLANGANVNLEDCNGRTVIDYAELFFKKYRILYSEARPFISNLYDEIIKILLNTGAKKGSTRNESK